MTRKINVAVTGFYGTGSGAVVDLLREYEEMQVVPYKDVNYEHVAFYANGGLFDAVSLLTRGNNPFSSDAVIHNFKKAMHRINDYDYLWFGSYKKMFHNDFIKLCDNFVEEISTSRISKNSNHVMKSRFSIVKAMMQIVARVLFKKKFTQYGIKYIYDSKTLYCAMPSEEELYKAAKAFTSGYFSLFDKFTDKQVKVFDHAIWASEIDAFKDCFDDDFRVIVVDRDPRDVYLCDQYIWSKPPIRINGEPHFPTDIDEFVSEWKKTIISTYRNHNALHIHFEDLIYDYDQTVNKIERFIGVPLHHVNKGKVLEVEKSIENTQLFNVNDEWKKQSEKIAEGLSEYLYSFPYERTPDRKKMFDR